MAKTSTTASRSLCRATLFGAVLLALSACDATAPDEDALPLLPLQLGNRWIMERTITDENGKTIEVTTDTVTVVEERPINGASWFLIRAASQTGFGGYTSVRNDSLWFWADPTNPNAAPYLQFAYPARVGSTYPYAPHRYRAEARVLDTQARISVPAGSFSCYYYEIAFDTLLPDQRFSETVRPNQRYLSPGVGFVHYETQYWRVEADEFVLHRRYTWRLVRFESA